MELGDEVGSGVGNHITLKGLFWAVFANFRKTARKLSQNSRKTIEEERCYGGTGGSPGLAANYRKQCRRLEASRATGIQLKNTNATAKDGATLIWRLPLPTSRSNTDTARKATSHPELAVTRQLAPLARRRSSYHGHCGLPGADGKGYLPIPQAFGGLRLRLDKKMLTHQR